MDELKVGECPGRKGKDETETPRFQRKTWREFIREDERIGIGFLTETN